MKRNTCLVITRDPEIFEQKLHRLDLPDLDIIIGRDESTITASIAQANILFGDPTIIRKYINQAPKANWVQSTFAGIDALIHADLRQDYVLTNVKETYGKAMAEYVFAYVLAIHRKVFANKQWQASHTWNQFAYETLEQKTIGIVGTGSIGREIARVAHAFDMQTHGLNTTGNSSPDFDRTFSNTELAKFFKGLDYVVSVLPNTASTQHFFCKKTFALIKNEAWFLNIGRGNSVDENDLMQALHTKQIAGAVLDVFGSEPLPSDSPLWETPNLFITPHVSGYVTNERIFEIFAQNYDLYRQQKPLFYQVDFAKGY